MITSGSTGAISTACSIEDSLLDTENCSGYSSLERNSFSLSGLAEVLGSVYIELSKSELSSASLKAILN